MATYYLRGDNVLGTTQTTTNNSLYLSIVGGFYDCDFSIKVEIGNTSWTTITNQGGAPFHKVYGTYQQGMSSGISYSFPGKASMSTGDKIRITVQIKFEGTSTLNTAVFTTAALNKTSLAAETWTIYYGWLMTVGTDYGDGEDETGTDCYLQYGGTATSFNSRIEGITLSEAGGGSVITKTQTAIGRLSKTGLTKTQPAVSRMSKLLTKTQSSIANIVPGGTVKTKTQTATASIIKVFTKTQTSTSRVARSYTKTQTAKCWISDGSNTKNQSATAHIFNPGQEFDQKLVLVKEADGTTLSVNTWLNAGDCGTVSEAATSDTTLRLKSNATGYHRTSTTLSFVGNKADRFKMSTTGDYSGRDWGQSLTVGNVDSTGIAIYLRARAVTGDDPAEVLQAQISFTNIVEAE